AEDGIRNFHVTGVQTCALPICAGSVVAWRPETMRTLLPHLAALQRLPDGLAAATAEVVAAVAVAVRTMFAADVGIAVGYPYLAGDRYRVVQGSAGIQVADPSSN